MIDEAAFTAAHERATGELGPPWPEVPRLPPPVATLRCSGDRCNEHLADFYLVSDGLVLRPGIDHRFEKRVSKLEQRARTTDVRMPNGRVVPHEEGTRAFYAGEVDKLEVASSGLEEVGTVLVLDLLIFWPGLPELLPSVPLFCGRHRLRLAPVTELVSALRSSRMTRVVGGAVLTWPTNS